MPEEGGIYTFIRWFPSPVRQRFTLHSPRLPGCREDLQHQARVGAVGWQEELGVLAPHTGQERLGWCLKSMWRKTRSGG